MSMKVGNQGNLGRQDQACPRQPTCTPIVRDIGSARRRRIKVVARRYGLLENLAKSGYDCLSNRLYDTRHRVFRGFRLRFKTAFPQRA